MTDDELRRAAESVLANTGRGPSCGSVRCELAFLHARKVSEAYLAEHPADDGTAVTVEWLQSVGFWERAEDWVSPPYGRHENGTPWRLVWSGWNRSQNKPVWELSFPGCTASLGYDLPTRGDVRRLCRVIRAPLAEGGAG